MKASSRRAATPSIPSGGGTMRSLALFVSVDVLFYLWTLNYNKLGSFYDYSILADAAGKLGAGLRPFRDFSSALQSFPVWLARGCELIFGPRYLALAYGNLILTLILFIVVLHYAKKQLPYLLSILIAMAVTVASSLQHGIIWYNSIALLLLSAVSLKCADLVRLPQIRIRDISLLPALLLLIGMTKLNFDAVAIGTAAFFAVVGLTAPRRTIVNGQNGKNYFVLGALCTVCCAAPPFLEVLANHTNLSTWAREVVRTPASRAGGLASLFSSEFYIKEWNSYYPGTILDGSVLVCLLVYGFVAYAVVNHYLALPKSERAENVKPFVTRLALLCLFWSSACLLVLTNVEIESLCLTYCLIGLIAMLISGKFSDEKCKKAVQIASAILALYFLVVGGVSMAKHSRISYVGNDFARAAPPAAGGPAYLRGVILSPQAAERLVAANEVLKNNSGARVYWGPGMELMNRVYGGITDPGFPLWYHLNVTIRDVDARSLIDAIEHSNADLFVSDARWQDEIPTQVRDYLEQSWDRQDQYAPLLVYARKPH